MKIQNFNPMNPQVQSNLLTGVMFQSIAEIFLCILKMNTEQRNLVETICVGISKGEHIAFVDENNC